MIICWDNLECLIFNKKTKKLYNPKDVKHPYYFCICKYCNEEYITTNSKSNFCDKSCGSKYKWKSMTNEQKEKYKETYLIGSNNPNFGNGAKISGNNNPSKRKEVREKISKKTSGSNNGMYGKKHTEKSINLNKEKNTGENHYLNKMSLDDRNEWITSKLRGNNNPNWKGGLSKEPYCNLWTDWYKKEIKIRDKNRCQNFLCENKIKRLCVHHIDYNKKNCHIKNLITLCISCNSKANSEREWHQKYYGEIIRRKYED